MSQQHTPAISPIRKGERKPASNPDLLNPQEASSLLGVHPISLRRWRAAGKLTAFRLPGGSIRFKREDLMALLEVAVA